MNRQIVIILLLVVIMGLLFIFVRNSSLFKSGDINQLDETSSTGKESYKAEYVGGQVCSNCHKEQFEHWSGSHHDLAMQVANNKSVLADFNDTKFNYFNVTSEFYRSEDKYMVRTDGPDGKLRDYEIKYTFGYYPLQQYLIEFPDGRLQVLGIAWDTRPESEGGQRWFHLYTDEQIDHDDDLHWTGPNQNWNFMCADCHSTNLKKNYNSESNSFSTTWSDINVSCEACHGPGSEHVKWAQSLSDSEKEDRRGSNNGLTVHFNQSKGIEWKINPETGSASRSRPRESNTELEVCAVCHSRRRIIWDEHIHGKPFMDKYMPALLDERLYYHDGQIKEEVYVYGSFLQSRMYEQGVSCTDCHEPHSLKLRKSGNELCTQCHLSTKFDTPAHHFHKVGSEGSSCLGCHMPVTKYMVVDPRHDHSIRIPRPDFSVRYGTPNACNKCHSDRTAQWAEKKTNEWYSIKIRGQNDYVEALYAGRSGSPVARQLLSEVAGNASYPNIARATALRELRSYLSPQSIKVLEKGLADNDPLVRAGALDALEGLDPDSRFQIIVQLLTDPVRAVRVRAARMLASVPPDKFTKGQRVALGTVLDEYIHGQLLNADRPEAHLNLGILYTDLGRFKEAESSYIKAMELQPGFVQSHVNLADLYRIRGMDEKGEKLLLEAMKLEPDNADIHHAYGLLLVRKKKTDEALKSLEKAAKLADINARYNYVYAVALNSVGKSDQAIEVLKLSHDRNPNDRETLYALVTFNRDIGKIKESIYYADKLIEQFPWDTNARQLRDQLGKVVK